MLIQIFVLTFLGTLLVELSERSHRMLIEALEEEDQTRPR